MCMGAAWNRGLVGSCNVRHHHRPFLTYHADETEGVLVTKKDFYSIWTYKSPEGDKDISLPNLEVINLLKSLKSSGYVKETFNWCVRKLIVAYYCCC